LGWLLWESGRHPFCFRCELAVPSFSHPVCAVHFIFHASAICIGANMARILIADDNKRFRTFLRTLLEQRHDDWSVCGVRKQTPLTAKPKRLCIREGVLPSPTLARNRPN